jgi:hypothetical protein
VGFTGFSLLAGSVPFTLYGAVVSEPTGPQPVSSGGSGPGSGGSTSGSGSSQTATPPSNSGPTYYYQSSSPVVTAVTPAPGSTGVSRSAPIRITFDRAMDPTTFTASTVVLSNSSGAQVAATLSYDANTNTVTLTPSVALDAFMVYTVLVKGGSNGVKDPYGNTMSADYTMSFTTGG